MRSAQQRREMAEEAFDRLASAETVTRDMLEEALGAEIGPDMNKNYGSLILRRGLLAEAMDIVVRSDNDKAVFRAAWAVGTAYDYDRKALALHAGRLIEHYIATGNGSVQRIYGKMVSDIIRRGLTPIDDSVAERLAAKAFDLLLDPGVRVAVKVWCMEILFCFVPQIGWVAGNLKEAVETVMEREPSRGMVNRARKILARLGNDIHNGNG